MVKEFAGKKGVAGFMVTSARAGEAAAQHNRDIPTRQQMGFMCE
jgi:hypothetical protein